MNTLFLRLEGPLQSWGVRSRWGERDTTAAPTKSGLLGLLGCAGFLVYHMNNEQGFAVRSCNATNRRIEDREGLTLVRIPS